MTRLYLHGKDATTRVPLKLLDALPVGRRACRPDEASDNRQAESANLRLQSECEARIAVNAAGG